MLYCCTVDVVERELPTTKVKYPLIRKRLLELVKADQKEREKPWELRPDMTEAEWAELMEPDWVRAREVLEILEQITVPSARNIGLDGSRAVWLIALHNTGYKGIADIVLKKMKYLYYKDKSQVFCPGIPYLVDRVMVQRNGWQKTNKQLYGTQGYYDDNGAMHVCPIIKPSTLEERRKKFELATIGKCRHTNE